MRQVVQDSARGPASKPRGLASHELSVESSREHGPDISKLSILLVEDDPIDVRLFCSLLDCAYPGAFDVCSVSSLRVALERVRHTTFDTVCVDLRVTDASGMEIVEQLLGVAPDLALVVLSGYDSESLALQSVRSGAQDYLVKGQVSGAQIGQALRYAQERKRSEAHLLSSAHHDPLTGLANRRHFESRLSLAIKRANKEHRRLAAIIVDLDHFKPVNDTYGHAAGDALLREVSRRMEGMVRDTDLVGRIGGDEFAVLLPEVASEEEVNAIAERILSELRKPITAEGISLSVSASLGIAMSPPSEALPLALLDAADRAMYQAKRAGGNAVGRCPKTRSLASGPDDTVAPERLDDVYHLVYQPQVDTTGSMVSAEALLRSRLSDGSILRATTLVPDLTRRGALIGLSAFVLRAACSTLRDWCASNSSCPRVAVNLAVNQLTDPAFASMLSAAVTEAGLSVQSLELEIDLNSTQALPSSIETSLRNIAADGYHLVLDNFSESSLCWLRTLPISGVKLSPCLQKPALEQHRAKQYLQGVVGLAHAVGAWVGATRIQTTQQAKVFQDIGCDRFQGYLFAAPRGPDHCSWVSGQEPL